MSERGHEACAVFRSTSRCGVLLNELADFSRYDSAQTKTGLIIGDLARCEA